MDDIIVPGATFEENIQRLKHTLDRFLSAGLKLKPPKCVFFETSGKCLDHIVSENGVSTDPEKKQDCTRLGQTKDPKTLVKKNKKHKTNTKTTSPPPTLIM
jgi:hypothetical protein